MIDEKIDYEKKYYEVMAELEHYKKILGVGGYNPSGEGFVVLIEQLRQRTKFIKDFKIVEKIGNVAKDDPVYARATDLIEGLPSFISKINSLALELKIEYVPENAKDRQSATTPQSLIKRN